MALLKIEEICSECNKHYVLAIKQDDAKDITCCPFCGTAIEVTDAEDNEE